jgi:hypothetical protein
MYVNQAKYLCIVSLKREVHTLLEWANDVEKYELSLY